MPADTREAEYLARRINLLFGAIDPVGRFLNAHVPGFFALDRNAKIHTLETALANNPGLVAGLRARFPPDGRLIADVIARNLLGELKELAPAFPGGEVRDLC